MTTNKQNTRERVKDISASLVVVFPALIIVLAVLLMVTEGADNHGVMTWGITIVVVAVLAIATHLTLAYESRERVEKNDKKC